MKEKFAIKLGVPRVVQANGNVEVFGTGFIKSDDAMKLRRIVNQNRTADKFNLMNLGKCSENQSFR